MKKKFFRSVEWTILICSLILLVIGTVAIYSATQEAGTSEFKKQIMWGIICMPVVIVVMLIDYNKLARFSIFFYIIFVILLIGVLFTKPINGARSWYVITKTIRFQPSEMAKIFVIMFLSKMIVKMQENNRSDINKFHKLLIILVLAGLPIGLIILQPDYGTAMAFVLATVFMIFVSGIDKKYIIVMLLLIAILVPLSYIYFLPEHAKTRIEVFLNPESDPRGAGYNIIQSKLAIRCRKIIWNGNIKRKSNSNGIFIS